MVSIFFEAAGKIRFEIWDDAQFLVGVVVFIFSPSYCSQDWVAAAALFQCKKTETIFFLEGNRSKYAWSVV